MLLQAGVELDMLPMPEDVDAASPARLEEIAG